MPFVSLPSFAPLLTRRRLRMARVTGGAALGLLILGVASTPKAHAQLLFTLTPADMTAPVGGTVTFKGTLTNRFTQRIYLNGLTGQFTQTGAATIDQNSFFTFAPEFLDPNQIYSDNLFNAMLSSSATVGTTYDGVVNIQGGSDPLAQQFLASQNLTVTATSAVTPAPPAAPVFAALGALGVGLPAIRQRLRARRGRA